MPQNRPGRMAYVTAGAARTHGAPVTESNFVGVAVKQRARGWDSTVAQQSTIDNGEPYAIIVKGKVLVDNVAGFAKGDAVYITAATGVLSETSAGNVKFGRVTEIPAERGTPAGKAWVDLDLKDSI
jgi:hypothetical protein